MEIELKVSCDDMVFVSLGALIRRGFRAKSRYSGRSRTTMNLGVSAAPKVIFKTLPIDKLQALSSKHIVGGSRRYVAACDSCVLWIWVVLELAVIIFGVTKSILILFCHGHAKPVACDMFG